MRTSLLLATCLLAASTANALQVARAPFASPPHLRLEKRLLPGYNGGGNGNSNSDNGGLNAGGTTSQDDSRSTASTSSATSTSIVLATTTSQTTATATRTSSSATSTSTRSSSSSSAAQSSTDSQGSVVRITSTISMPTSSSTAALVASQTATAAPETSTGSSHTGLIVGVSVVGGIALLGALIFLYMKFGGKRFSDYQDDDHDIKWPELKTDDQAAAMQPLPARRTGGAGFDMGEDSEPGHDNLDRQSMTEYGGAKGQESVLGSTTALNTGIGAGAATNYSASGYPHDTQTSAYEDNSPYSVENTGGVTGYYDPYSNYGHSQSQGAPQVFYPEQVGNTQNYQQGYETSPQSGPHHVGGQYGYY